jgi:hypothetical protein
MNKKEKMWNFFLIIAFALIIILFISGCELETVGKAGEPPDTCNSNNICDASEDDITCPHDCFVTIDGRCDLHEKNSFAPTECSCIDIDPGNSYYIDVRGVCGVCSDDNSYQYGGTIANPWCSLERPLYEFPNASWVKGKNIFIRDGIYRMDKDYNVHMFWYFDGTPENPTIISGYPGEQPIFYLSEKMTGWQEYSERPESNIYYLDWKTYMENKYPLTYANYPNLNHDNYTPHAVYVDQEEPIIMQEVNSYKNYVYLAENPELRWAIPESYRTNQTDMIAGDFYYENNASSSEFGMLYIWLPDGSDPNTKNIEVGIDKFLHLKSNNFQLRNLSFRYASSSGYGQGYTGLFYIEGYNITIDGCDFSYNDFAAFAGNCTNCIVNNSRLSYLGNNAGNLWGNGLVYENNIIKNNNWKHYSYAWHSGGLKLIASGIPHVQGNITFRYNLFENNDGQGLWFDGMGAGNLIENNIFRNNSGSILFEITNGTLENPNIIRNNLIYDRNEVIQHMYSRFYDGGVSISSSDYTYVYNNIFYNLPGAIRLSVNGNDLYPKRNSLIGNKIYNNIVMNTSVGIIAYENQFYKGLGATVEDNVYESNIYFNPGPSIYYEYLFSEGLITQQQKEELENKTFWYDGEPFDGGSWRFRYNFSGWQDEGFDDNSQIADPLFIDIDALDFRLQESSPAFELGFMQIVCNDHIDCYGGGVCKDGWCKDCVPNLMNTSYVITNISCLPSGKMNQSRTVIEYDANYCGEVDNQTYNEYIAVEDCGREFEANLDMIIRNIPINIEIDGSTDLHSYYQGIKNIKIKTQNNNLLEFNHDFDQNELNLSKIRLIKNVTNDKSYFYMSGLETTGTKIIYLDRNQSSNNAVCVLDEEVDNLTYLEENCYKFNCPGSYGSITCIIENNTFIVSGLEHSGVIEYYIEPSIGPSGGSSGGGGGSRIIEEEIVIEECKERWVCGDWMPLVCPSGETQTRNCEEVNDCGTQIQKPSTSKTCKYHAPIEEEPIGEPVQELYSPVVEDTSYLWIYIIVLVILCVCGGTGIVLYELEHRTREQNRSQNNLMRLQNHIIETKKEGCNKKKIKKVFLSNGYDSKTIEESFVLIKLQDYITKNLAKGYTKEQIKNIILRSGWKEEIVDGVFRRLGK